MAVSRKDVRRIEERSSTLHNVRFPSLINRSIPRAGPQTSTLELQCDYLEHQARAENEVQGSGELVCGLWSTSQINDRPVLVGGKPGVRRWGGTLGSLKGRLMCLVSPKCISVLDVIHNVPKYGVELGAVSLYACRTNVVDRWQAGSCKAGEVWRLCRSTVTQF